MPHVSIKLAPGRTEEQKQQLTTEITRALVHIARANEVEVTVAIEEVHPADWHEQVYQVDILPHWDHLYKEPGY